MRLKSYPKMKDSGVLGLGEIPKHWKIGKLKFVCEMNPSKNEVRKLPKNFEISFLSMEKIGTDGRLRLGERKHLSEVLDGFTYFRNGDVIVAKITPCFENGKGSLCEGLVNEIGFGTTELHVLRPKNEIDPVFTYWWTRSNQFMQNGEASMYGAAGQKRIPMEFIKNFEISYPELISEQKAIGKFLKKYLETTNEKIEKNGKLIHILKEKKQSLINQAVTKGLDPSVPMKDSGAKQVGQIPEQWQVQKIRYLIKFGNQGVNTAIDKVEYSDEGYPIIKAGNIRGKFELNDCDKITEESFKRIPVHHKPKLNDILFANIGAQFGTALSIQFSEPVSIAWNIFLMRLNEKVDSKFLECCINSSYVQEQIKLVSSMNTMSFIPKPDIQNLEILFPPKNEQEQISQFIEKEARKIDYILTKIKLQIKEFREFRQSLISNVVTGKIDVTSSA